MAFLHFRFLEQIFHRNLFHCSLQKKISCTFEIWKFLQLIENDFNSDFHFIYIVSVGIISISTFTRFSNGAKSAVQQENTCSIDSIEFLIAALNRPLDLCRGLIL